MQISPKGQVTIPHAIRVQIGLLPGTEVEFRVEGESVVLSRRSGDTGRGDRLVEHLRRRWKSPLTTEELLALTRGES